jgi:hypothetical protein
MDQLLNGRLTPITREVGFVRTDGMRLVEWFLAARQDEPDQNYRQRTVHGKLEELLLALLPLTTRQHRRFTFVPTRGEWTAFFSNGWRGTDAFITVSRAAEALSCESLRVVYRPDVGQGKTARAARVFELFGPQRTDWLNSVRSIAVANDGGRWTFEMEGEPLPFEATENYTAKRVSDRLTPEMLKSYCAALGIQAFEEDYYAPEHVATLIELTGAAPVGVRECSLEEAQTL